MKKKLLAVSCLAFAGAFAFGSCFGGGGDDSSNAGGGNKTIAAPLEIAGFDTSYNPVSDKIEKKSGVIDVVLVFEDSLKGWEALAKEYERLHGGSVRVQLNSIYTDASVYQQNLSYEVQSNDIKWDIVQGNLFLGGGLQDHCVNMYTAVNDENAYAGMVDGEIRTWSEVLTEDAYLTDKSGSNNSTYIMNSEGLQTAWFVNDVARDAAIAKGYKGSEIPATWDELMDLCKHMELAGYENPLGIALDKDSISASQFTWLLRVYGDYYYRNEYQNIMISDKYEYDPTAKNPEADMEYGVSANKFFCSIFKREDTTYYVGPESDKYQEFISQFEKMKPYLRTSAADGTQSGLAVLRSKFATQSEGKNSPQILLDYAGAGLKFQKSETAEFKLDFFDYPKMVSEGGYISPNTLLRDVGGNGGYLSIISQNETQDALNLDFVKFVVSPYGQTIYYDALQKAGSVPMGMTTVDNDTVVIPQAWETFFKTDKITFSGLVDYNPYISFLIRTFCDEEKTNAQAIKGWQTYLTTETMDTNGFVGEWIYAMEEDWKSYIAKTGKPATLRTDRNGNVKL